MNQPGEAEIADRENRLRTAMLHSDVAALNDLLAPGLIYTNHLGQVLGKEDDLAAHRSGVLKINSLRSSEQQIRFAGDLAIVSVRVHLTGFYDGDPVDGDLRFTRVWAASAGGAWQVAAAHASVVS